MLLFGRDALVPEGARGGRSSTSRSLKAGATSSKSPRRCRASSSRKSIPIWSKRSAMPPPIRNPATRRGAPKCATPACACCSGFCSCFMPKTATCLPVRHDGYRQYGLQPMREEAAAIIDGRRTVSDRRTTWWPRLDDLFGAIANGDPGMGLPPYNGGLFDEREAPLLTRIALPDRTLGRADRRLVARIRRQALDQLSRPLGPASRQHLRAPAGARGCGRMKTAI